jgi:ribonucleoside-diphosphate reductase alpha chain
VNAVNAPVQRRVRAREIFDLIAKTACETAEPGLLFWDTITRNLPLHGYPGFGTEGTNPCGEVPLSPNDSCRLLSLYLAPFVRNEFTADATFDWEAFRKAVRVATRLSDDLVDLELEKLRAIREQADTEDEQRLFDLFIEACTDGRRTGLGTHGLADALARLTLPYGCDAGLSMADSIYDTLKYVAYSTSVDLAEERGPFPAWDRDIDRGNTFIRSALPQALQMRMDRLGRRNGAILTNAPTGTRSLLSDNCASGIEPVYAISYERKRKVDPAKENVTPDYVDTNGDSWVRYTVFHSNVERFLQKALLNPGKYFPDLSEAQAASLRGYTFERFKSRVMERGWLPDYFVTSADIDPMTRVRMQATIQRHIDHSISSTINLPKGTTPETVAAIYLDAYKQGCKGVTVYVDGSRDAQVLSTEGQAEKDTDAPCPFCGEFLAQEEQVGHRCPELADVRVKAGLEAVSDKLAAEQAPHLTRTHRGDETTGQMRKASFRDHDGNERKVYVFIGTNDEGRPVEAFVVDEQGAEDFIPYGAALGKLVSLALKHGVPIEEVERMLIGLKGGAISFSGQVFNSVPDLVGKRLRQAREAWQTRPMIGVDLASGPDRTVVTEVRRSDYPPRPLVEKVHLLGVSPGSTVKAPLFTSEPSGTVCVSCNTASVIRQGGCDQCLSCGWSRCG